MNKVNDNDFIVRGAYNEKNKKNNISNSFNYSIDIFFCRVLGCKGAI